MRKKTPLVTTLMSIFLVSGCGPENYDECMLDEMRGQDRSTIGHAHNVCERRFPYEIEITLKMGKIDYDWSDGRILINTNRTNYEITKMLARFSKEKCSENNSDMTFLSEREVIFEAGGKIGRVSNFDASSKCMRLVKTFGKRTK